MSVHLRLKTHRRVLQLYVYFYSICALLYNFLEHHLSSSEPHFSSLSLRGVKVLRADHILFPPTFLALSFNRNIRIFQTFPPLAWYLPVGNLNLRRLWFSPSVIDKSGEKPSVFLYSVTYREAVQHFTSIPEHIGDTPTHFSPFLCDFFFSVRFSVISSYSFVSDKPKWRGSVVVLLLVGGPEAVLF